MLVKIEWRGSQMGAKYKSGRLKSAIFDQYLAISQKPCKL